MKPSSTYATVVIPTHDRHSTLPFSVQSAVNQSCRDIEVLIVGDGCTDQVRHVANQWVQIDARVRFMDLPKQPNRGALNRDLAVRQAIAPRIFYNDDDDLLLPNHVAELGAELDDCDIVDTPVVTVQTNGNVALGIGDSGHPLQRQMLVNEHYKGVFDTHLAHTKSSYLSRSGAWMNGSDHRVVLHMLKTFAGDPAVRWKTLPRVTALSFHGARRVMMSAEDRKAELQSWLPRICTPGIVEEIRTNASYCGYAFALLNALSSLGNEQKAQFLTDIGLLSDECAESSESNAPQKTDAQRTELLATKSLIEGQRINQKLASAVLTQLAEPRLGPAFLVADYVNLLGKLYNSDELVSIVGQLPNSDAATLLRLHLHLSEGAVTPNRDRMLDRQFDDAASHSRFFFGLSVAQNYARFGNSVSAWAWTDRLLPLVVESRHMLAFWALRKTLAAEMGYTLATAIASERLEALASSPV